MDPILSCRPGLPPPGKLACPAAPLPQGITRRAGLGFLGGLGGLAAGLGGLSPRARAAHAPLAVAPLAHRRHRLANGLELIAQPGGTGDSVAVQVWYRVGGKDDPPGRSGFAHLFEHLMFKRTKHLPAEAFDRLTEDVGGENNAFTAEDVTVYQNRVPANHLERILWAEAERMANLDVDEASFHSERAVVQEEYRQRVLASPYGRLFEAIAPAAFQVHPYRRPVIGSIADLDAATLADVRAFHATYYRPDNAVLIVSGRFDEDRLLAAAERWFAPLPRPAQPVPQVQAVEPVRRTGRTWALQGPQVPLPAALCVWQGVPATHPDAPALNLAQALLSGSDAARMERALVRRQRIARSTGFGVSCLAQGGHLTAYAIAASGRPPAGLVAPMREVLATLAEGPVPDEELARVQARWLTGTLAARQTPEGRAEALGWATVLHGDPAHADEELRQMQAVGPAEIRGALQRHVLSRPPVVIHYTQQRDGAGGRVPPQAKDRTP